MTRPVVAGVVGGGAVREVREPHFALHRRECVEQLLFAVKAAIRMVSGVSIELDLFGGDLDQARSEECSDGARLSLLRLGVGGRAREHRNRALAELVHGELQEQRRVDAS